MRGELARKAPAERASSPPLGRFIHYFTIRKKMELTLQAMRAGADRSSGVIGVRSFSDERRDSTQRRAQTARSTLTWHPRSIKRGDRKSEHKPGQRM